MLRCRTCGRVVAVRYPKSGDGSAVLAYRHPDLDGQPCEGSGAEYTGAELQGAIVGRRRARPASSASSASSPPPPELDQAPGSDPSARRRGARGDPGVARPADLRRRDPRERGQPARGPHRRRGAGGHGRAARREPRRPRLRGRGARGAELRQKFAERTSGRWLKKRLIVGATLYQLQFMRCGQKRCKRCHGDHDDPTRAHGPYWVAYTTKSERGGAPGRGGRWKLRYIGKDPSGEGPEFLEALARAR
jgi:hypothetical protein